MPVDSVDSVDYSKTYTRDNSNDINNSMVSTDTFLKLLVAQLKYQDPLSPQDNTQFVTQLAQMTSLQEMQSMKSSMQNAQAYDMIGKVIYAVVYEKATNEMVEYGGLVESVIIQKGVPYVVVGDTMISLDDVQQVFDPALYEDTTETTDTTDTSGDSTTG